MRKKEPGFQLDQGWMAAKERCHALLVLLRLDRTGRIDQASAGAKMSNGGSEQPILQGGQRIEILAPHPPARLRAPAKHSGIRTGGINEDMGKALSQVDRLRLRRHAGRLPGTLETREIGIHQRQA